LRSAFPDGAFVRHRHRAFLAICLRTVGIFRFYP
jgi:hypothetical protein